MLHCSTTINQKHITGLLFLAAFLTMAVDSLFPVSTPKVLTSTEVLDLTTHVVAVHEKIMDEAISSRRSSKSPDNSSYSLTLSSSSSRAFSFQKRARWGSSKGTWIAAREDPFVCIAHLIGNTAAGNNTKYVWRMHLWLLSLEATSALPSSGSKDKNKKEIEIIENLVSKTLQTAISETIVESLSPEIKVVTILLSAIDRDILPTLRKMFSSNALLPMNEIYAADCGMYTVLPKPPANIENDALYPDTTISFDDEIRLGEEFKIRNLTLQDADIVDEHWEYRRPPSSVEMIRSMIESDSCLSIGVENIRNGELCAWILQYEEGTVGMLFCHPPYRKQGLGTALVRMATAVLFSKGEWPLICYILDSNEASQRVFTKVGWNRSCSADWIGFSAEIDQITAKS